MNCTVDSCTPGVGCEFQPQDDLCDDEEPCTLDSCLSGSGCQHTPVEPASPCPGNGICSGNGVCKPLDEIGENTPLLRKNTPMTLTTSEEVAVLIPDASPAVRIWDDKVENDDSGAVWGTNPLQIGTTGELFGADLDNGRILRVATGDVDGDALDEFVVVSLYTDGYTTYQNVDYRFDWPLITIVDDAESGFATIATLDQTNLDLSVLNGNVDSICDIDIDLGDVDGDGKDEIALVGVFGRVKHTGNQWLTEPYSSIIWVLDDHDADNALILTDTESMFQFEKAAIALGDADGNEADEIFVIGEDDHFVKALAFVDGIHEWYPYTVASVWHSLDNPVFEYYARSPQLATGDFDGDGIDEVVFGSVTSDGMSLWFVVYDDMNHDWIQLEDKKITSTNSQSWDTANQPIFEAGDVNGDGVDDVVVAVEDWYSGAHEWWHYFAFFVDTDSVSELGGPWGDGITVKSTPIVTLGDVDRDLADEIFIAWNEVEEVQGNPGDDPTIVSTHMLRQWKYSGGDGTLVGEWNFGEGDAVPAVAVGDFDGDNMTVLYSGKHWTHISEPRLMVAMAMPPVWTGIDQQYGSTFVYFGQSESYSESVTTEVSSTSSITLSSSAKDPLQIIEVKGSLKLQWGFSQSQTQTSSTSMGIKRYASWSEDNPQNYVIFSAAEYHRFEYEVLTHPEDKGVPVEDQKYVGTLFTLDVPTETNTYMKPVSSFNTATDNVYAGVLEEVFPQTLGDPSTYPSPDVRDELLNTYGGGWANPKSPFPLVPVPEGTSSVLLSVTENEQDTTAEGMSFGVTDSVGINVLGIGLETSVGITNSEIYRVTVGEQTEYGGKVGGILENDYADYSYKFGFFVYNYADEVQQDLRFQVLQWCAELTLD